MIAQAPQHTQDPCLGSRDQDPSGGTLSQCSSEECYGNSNGEFQQGNSEGEQGRSAREIRVVKPTPGNHVVTTQQLQLRDQAQEHGEVLLSVHPPKTANSCYQQSTADIQPAATSENPLV